MKSRAARGSVCNVLLSRDCLRLILRKLCSQNDSMQFVFEQYEFAAVEYDIDFTAFLAWFFVREEPFKMVMVSILVGVSVIPVDFGNSTGVATG